MKTTPCANCEKEMKVDVEPYLYNEKDENTAKISWCGSWVCSQDCDDDLKRRTLRNAEGSQNINY